ncbi:hypothetical protein PAHAL_9G245900 [Panicum hallii]|uniref:FLZ-type domain-containing protein n=1 Tax=Panicum hallii TaxID=206008 RepID=A0A2S3IM34_9POAL|nr:protein MARD1-like [Panicum hallii]XP_025793566.1 protein MARD1-like [Panicum hallii]PAN47266.1 hypothetical protein PAHAL_9G245900 [Panicum hallii]
MLGRMASGAVAERRAALLDRTGTAVSAASPLLAPPKLFVADGGVSGGSPVVVAEAAIMSPTSSLQAAVGSPASPAATAAPFSRHGASSSSGGDNHRCKSKSRRPAWEAAMPTGLGLAGALNGGDAVPPAATVLTGQSFRRAGPASAAADRVSRSTFPQGRRRRWLMSPGEMEASEDYTRVIAGGGPNPRTTHMFDGRVVVDGCGGFPVGAGGEVGGFLRWCHGCSKDLEQGKDIFMYRGEMAFCSHECRFREMLLFDEES